MVRTPRRSGRRLLMLIAAVCTSATLSSYPISNVHAGTDPVVDDSIVESDATTNDFMDLERSITECISSNPPPGCGRVPTSPGDRGGWQQLVLFGVMMGGIAVIFWRVSRAVRSRDTPRPTADQPGIEPESESRL